jgi:hypothetical protein
MSQAPPAKCIMTDSPGLRLAVRRPFQRAAVPQLSDQSLGCFIDFTLQKARSTRCRHAVRHVREIESQQSDIKDYGRGESHAEFIARLKRQHSRKPAFWRLLAA